MLRVYSIILFFALANQSASAQTEPVKLRWVNIPYATAYEIEVESAGAKGRPLVVRTVAIPELGVDLPPGSYVYRARGIGEKGKGPWSDKQAFEIKAEAVALLAPTPDAKADAGSRLVFSWKTLSGYRYRIQIADSKGVISDHEVTEGTFSWTPPAAGNYRWRVAYANIAGAPWSELRSVHVNTPANVAVNTKIEKPHSRWAQTLWVGTYVNSFAGDFADVGNNVSASTLSGSYAWEIERKHERFSPYSEPRPSLLVEVDQQSLVKKTVWLPDLDLSYNHLWAIRYLKIGPHVDARYFKTGFFTADASGNYQTDSFWRTAYSAGIYGEYLFKKFVLNSYFKFGGASKANSGLAPGGIKPSSTFEAAIGGKLNQASRWTMQVRMSKEDVAWTSSLGNNSLNSTIWSLALGGEL